MCVRTYARTYTEAVLHAARQLFFLVMQKNFHPYLKCGETLVAAKQADLGYPYILCSKSSNSWYANYNKDSFVLRTKEPWLYTIAIYA